MIDDIKFSTGDMSRQFELQQPFGIDIVMDGFFGDDGDAEAAGNKVFDGFLIIDAGSILTASISIPVLVEPTFTELQTSSVSANA